MDTPSTPPPIAIDYATRRPGPRKYHAAWLLLLLPVGFLLMISVASLTSVGGPRDVSNRVKSASNLRQIGQAILLYSNDNNGQYPDCLQRLLFAEDIPSNVFVHPAGPDTPATGPTTQAIADQMVSGGHLSYVYIGRGMNSRTISPDTVVAYEQPSLNAGQGINILFGDGHVEFVTAAQAAPMLAKVAAGESPVKLNIP